MGRPLKDIDENRVAELAYGGASNREIGDLIGVDDKTVKNRFSALLAKQRARRRFAIREAQTRLAMDGNPTMLIWLGKQELGQQDRQTVTHRGDDDTPRIVPRGGVLPKRKGVGADGSGRRS